MSAAPGPKHFEKWTESDDALLRDLAAKLSQTELAMRMGRTSEAIKTRATKLHIKLKPNKRFRYLF